MSTPTSKSRRKIGELLGMVEIAEFLDVGRRTPHAWADRDLLPPDDGPQVNGLRTWRRETILVWAAETGRLPKRLHKELPEGVTVESRLGGPDGRPPHKAGTPRRKPGPKPGTPRPPRKAVAKKAPAKKAAKKVAKAS